MSNSSHLTIVTDIRSACNANITLTPQNAKRFFKTAAGSYGGEDEFLGSTAPNLLKTEKIYKAIYPQVIQEPGRFDILFEP